MTKQDINQTIEKIIDLREESKYTRAKKLIYSTLQNVNPKKHLSSFLKIYLQLMYIHYREGDLTQVKQRKQEIGVKIDNLKNETERKQLFALYNYILGNCYFMEGENKTALNMFKESKKYATQMDYERGIIQTNNMIANIAGLRHQYSKAIKLYQENLELAERSNDEKFINYSLVNLSNCYRIQGKLDLALQYLDKVNDKFDTIKNIETKAVIYNNYGIVHYFKDELEIADDYLEKSFYLLSKLDNDYHMSECLYFQALITKELGNIEQFQDSLKKFDELVKNSENPYVLFRQKLVKAISLSFEHDFMSKGKAERLLIDIYDTEFADEIYTQVTMIRLCDFLLDQLKLHTDRQLIERINTILDEIEQMVSNKGSYILEINFARLKAKESQILGDFDNALKYLNEAKIIAEENKIYICHRKVLRELTELIEDLTTNVNLNTISEIIKISNSDNENLEDSDKLGELVNYKDKLYKFLPLLHPIRLSVLKVLVKNRLILASKLRECLSLSWGNFHSHIDVLENNKIVKKYKEFQNSGYANMVELTELGFDLYAEFIHFTYSSNLNDNNLVEQNLNNLKK